MPYGPRTYPLVPLPQAPDPMQSLAGLMSLASNVEQYQAERKQRQQEQRRQQTYAQHKGDPAATSAALTEAGDFAGAQFFAGQAEQARSKRDEAHAKAILPFALTKDANGIDTYDRALLTREFTAANLADRLPALLKGLDEADTAALNLQKAKREYAQQGFKALLDSVDAAGATPQALQLAAKKGIANGFWSEEEAAQILNHVGDDPARAQEVVRRLRSEKPEKPVLHNVPAGTSVIDAARPEAGSVFTAPAAPARPNTIQEALLDPTLTPARQRDLLALQRQLSAAQRQPDAPVETAAVQAVLNNPRLWRALNPELRGKMLAPLARAGFNFPEATEGMTQLEIERLRVADIRALDRDRRRTYPGSSERIMSDEIYADEKALIEDFYRELRAEPEPPKPSLPPPAAATRGMLPSSTPATENFRVEQFRFTANRDGTVTVMAPDGTSATFPSRAEADAEINEFLNQR